MTIRKNTYPRQNDLQPEMQQLLMRNGIQAHVVSTAGGSQLIVQGHDSPLLTYNITDRQAQALTDWGTNYANKTAYNTFTEIVGNDFDMPKDFVHAHNANGRVAMGLHGYRVGTGEYGREPADRVDWTPRQQDGFHLRRAGGALFYQGAPMVAERPDGRMKPGELQSGGYGFYYKGTQQQDAVVQQDVLQDLQAVIVPSLTRPRSEEPAVPYDELVTSPVYFSNEKWQECLASHGIIIDEDAGTLTIQSDGTPNDMVYDLRDDEMKTLTSNSLEEAPVADRLATLNNIIKDDFADDITMDMLNGTSRIDITLRPDIQQELSARQQDDEQYRPFPDRDDAMSDLAPYEQRGDAGVSGYNLVDENDNKGWYREGAHGREVEVGDIFVEKIPRQEEDKGKGKGNEAIYRMTAVINGEAVSHEITQKDYDKFLAVDDYHRMKLFSKVFSEVDMKTRPETRTGLGTKIFAALTAGAVVTAEVMHDGHHRPAPEFYGEAVGNAPRPYFKAGVDSPQEVAARNFEAQANRVTSEMRRGY